MQQSNGQVQYWLPPGPQLPMRTWQRKSHSWVKVVSASAATIFAISAMVVLIMGLISAQQKPDFSEVFSLLLTMLVGG